MQQTGGLTKRRRRNLTKVTGLSVIPYNETLDNYSGANLFQSLIEPIEIPSNVQYDKNPEHTSITMSRILSAAGFGNMKSSSFSRVTRDPKFSHDPTKNATELSITSEDAQDHEDEPKCFKKPEITYDNSQNGANGNENSQNGANGYKPCFPISQLTIWFLRLIIITATSSFFLPWTWNTKTRRVDLWKSNFLKKVQHIVLVGFTCQTVGILIFQLNIVKNNFINYPNAHRGTFQHMFIALWYIMNILNNLNSYFNGEKSRLYINALLDLNEQYTARFVVDKTQFKEDKQYMFACIVPEFWLHIPVLMSQFAQHPSQFFYLYSYVYFPENGWYWTLPGLFHEFLLTAQTTGGDILALWILFVHASSTDFWLNESHKNNNTGQTTEELREPKVAIEVYKTLLVITKSFNDCMAAFGIAICKVLGCFGPIFCCYVLIRTTGEDFVKEFPLILTFVAGAPACFSIAILALNLSAKIFDLGVSFLGSWDNTKQKDFRRIIMACPTIKVQMGHFYVITVSTTVTFFQVVVGYLIDAIITFP